MAPEWKAFAEACTQMSKFATEAARKEEGRKTSLPCAMDDRNFELLKELNTAVKFKHLLPPSFPTDPKWKDACLVQMCFACMVEVPSVYRELAAECPEEITPESIVSWALTAVDSVQFHGSINQKDIFVECGTIEI